MPTKQEGRRRGERHLEDGSMKCFSNCQVFQQILCRKTKTTATAAATPLSFHENLHHY
jgi:hypothetical protein